MYIAWFRGLVTRPPAGFQAAATFAIASLVKHYDVIRKRISNLHPNHPLKLNKLMKRIFAEKITSLQSDLTTKILLTGNDPLETRIKSMSTSLSDMKESLIKAAEEKDELKRHVAADASRNVRV